MSDVEVVEPVADMPNLPVAQVMWRPTRPQNLFRSMDLRRRCSPHSTKSFADG